MSVNVSTSISPIKQNLEMKVLEPSEDPQTRRILPSLASSNLPQAIPASATVSVLENERGVTILGVSDIEDKNTSTHRLLITVANIEDLKKCLNPIVAENPKSGKKIEISFKPSPLNNNAVHLINEYYMEIRYDPEHIEKQRLQRLFEEYESQLTFTYMMMLEMDVMTIEGKEVSLQEKIKLGVLVTQDAKILEDLGMELEEDQLEVTLEGKIGGDGKDAMKESTQPSQKNSKTWKNSELIREKIEENLEKSQEREIEENGENQVLKSEEKGNRCRRVKPTLEISIIAAADSGRASERSERALALDLSPICTDLNKDLNSPMVAQNPLLEDSRNPSEAPKTEGSHQEEPTENSKESQEEDKSKEARNKRKITLTAEDILNNSKFWKNDELSPGLPKRENLPVPSNNPSLGYQNHGTAPGWQLSTEENNFQKFRGAGMCPVHRHHKLPEDPITDQSNQHRLQEGELPGHPEDNKMNLDQANLSRRDHQRFHKGHEHLADFQQKDSSKSSSFHSREGYFPRFNLSRLCPHLQNRVQSNNHPNFLGNNNFSYYGMQGYNYFQRQMFGQNNNLQNSQFGGYQMGYLMGGNQAQNHTFQQEISNGRSGYPENGKMTTSSNFNGYYRDKDEGVNSFGAQNQTLKAENSSHSNFNLSNKGFTAFNPINFGYQPSAHYNGLKRENDIVSQISGNQHNNNGQNSDAKLINGSGDHWSKEQNWGNLRLRPSNTNQVGFENSNNFDGDKLAHREQSTHHSSRPGGAPSDQWWYANNQFEYRAQFKDLGLDQQQNIRTDYGSYGARNHFEGSSTYIQKTFDPVRGKNLQNGKFSQSVYETSPLQSLTMLEAGSEYGDQRDMKDFEEGRSHQGANEPGLKFNETSSHPGFKNAVAPPEKLDDLGLEKSINFDRNEENSPLELSSQKQRKQPQRTSSNKNRPQTYMKNQSVEEKKKKEAKERLGSQTEEDQPLLNQRVSKKKNSKQKVKSNLKQKGEKKRNSKNSIGINSNKHQKQDFGSEQDPEKERRRLRNRKKREKRKRRYLKKLAAKRENNQNGQDDGDKDSYSVIQN